MDQDQSIKPIYSTGILFLIFDDQSCNILYTYSKTPLLRPPLGLGGNGLYSGVVLLLG